MTKLFGKTIEARKGPVRTRFQIVTGVVSVLSLFFAVLVGQKWHSGAAILATFALVASFLVTGASSQIEVVSDSREDDKRKFLEEPK